MKRFLIQVETSGLPKVVNGKQDFRNVEVLKLYVGVIDELGNVISDNNGNKMLKTFYFYPDNLKKLPVSEQEKILKDVAPYNNGITLEDLQTKAKYGDFKNVKENIDKMLKGADEIVYWSSFARSVLVDKGITALNQTERFLRNLKYEIDNVFYDIDKKDRIMQRGDFAKIFIEGNKEFNNFEETCFTMKGIQTYKPKVMDRVKALFIKIGEDEKVKNTKNAGKDFTTKIIKSVDGKYKLNLSYSNNDIQFFIEDTKTHTKKPISLKDFMREQRYEDGKWNKMETSKIFPDLYNSLGKILKQELLVIEGNKFSVVLEFKDKEGNNIKAPVYKFFDYNVKNITEAYNYYSKADFNKDKVNNKDNVDNFTNLCKEAHSVKIGIYSQKDGYSLITEQVNEKYDEKLEAVKKQEEKPVFTDFDDFNIE